MLLLPILKSFVDITNHVWVKPNCETEPSHRDWIFLRQVNTIDGSSEVTNQELGVIMQYVRVKYLRLIFK